MNLTRELELEGNTSANSTFISLQCNRYNKSYKEGLYFMTHWSNSAQNSEIQTLMQVWAYLVNIIWMHDMTGTVTVTQTDMLLPSVSEVHLFQPSERVFVSGRSTKESATPLTRLLGQCVRNKIFPTTLLQGFLQ